jgi:hypothetical protein
VETPQWEINNNEKELQRVIQYTDQNNGGEQCQHDVIEFTLVLDHELHFHFLEYAPI